MKKMLPLLLCVVGLCGGCIDQDYDLNKIEAGDVTIGNDQSEFVMPLATVVVAMDELQDNKTNIKGMFAEVDIWLPTTLPGGADYVDIVRLANDEAYLDGILNALIEEMLLPGSQKMDDVVDLIWRDEDYRQHFTDLIPADSEEHFKTGFKEHFGGDDQLGEELRDKVSELVRTSLTDIRITPLQYDAKLNLGSSVIDMLSKNLDPEGTVNPVNTLFLYGEVISELPISFRMAPVFTGPQVTVVPFIVEPDLRSDIPATQFYKDDVELLINQFGMEVALVPQKYFPNTGFDDNQTIRMTLKLRKHGGLSLNL